MLEGITAMPDGIAKLFPILRQSMAIETLARKKIFLIWKAKDNLNFQQKEESSLNNFILQAHQKQYNQIFICFL